MRGLPSISKQEIVVGINHGPANQQAPNGTHVEDQGSLGMTVPFRNPPYGATTSSYHNRFRSLVPRSSARAVDTSATTTRAYSARARSQPRA